MVLTSSTISSLFVIFSLFFYSPAFAASALDELNAAAGPDSEITVPVPVARPLINVEVERVDISIKADPTAGTMKVQTRMSIEVDRSGASLDFELTKPASLLKFRDETLGVDISYRFAPFPGVPNEAGIQKFSFEILAGPAKRELLLEYEYDTATFFGVAQNPSTNDDLVLGQIGADSIYSSHLRYYPFRDDARPRSGTIAFDLPRGWTAVSSGELQQSGGSFRYQIPFDGGRLPYPIAIAKYEKADELFDNRFRVEIYHASADAIFAAEKLRLVVDRILPFLENLMGPYPFDNLRIVEVFPVRGNTGLAAKSVVMISQKMWFAEPIGADMDSNAAAVLVDEIAHQWNFYSRPLPNYLAEGVSEYTDGLFVESVKGAQSLEKTIADYRTSYVNITRFIGILHRYHKAGKDMDFAVAELGMPPEEVSPFWDYAKAGNVPISDPRVYPSLYFIKGAGALHAIRKHIGDDAFFSGLRAFFGTSSNAEAALKDLRAAFERSSGKSLESLFDQWYRQPGWPHVESAPSTPKNPE